MTACCLPWQCYSFLLGGGDGEWVRSEGWKFALKGADSPLWNYPGFEVTEPGLAYPLPLMVCSLTLSFRFLTHILDKLARGRVLQIPIFQCCQ